jgi:carbon-monoxide dehydrogenase medium subunit
MSNGKIQSARIGLTGAGPHATRLATVEQTLAGQTLTPGVLEAAARGAGAGIEQVNSDLHASEDYRRAMIGVFTRRALEAAMRRV